MPETTALSTEQALDDIAHERAPRYPNRNVNVRVVCGDGFMVSVQASPNHYAHDSHPSGEAAYWRGPDAGAVHPFTSFELGNPTGDIPVDGAWEEHDSGGVWSWVPRALVVELLESHGGVVEWEEREPVDLPTSAAPRRLCVPPPAVLSVPTRPHQSTQRAAFGRALCERLGLDPAIVGDNITTHLDSEQETGKIDLSVYLPTDEIIAMWNGADPKAGA